MILKQKAKHSEFTYGIHHQGLYDLVPKQGFTLLSNGQTIDILKQMDDWAMGARRSLIGKTALLRQAIAYTLGYKVVEGPAGAQVKFYLYRRNKKNGEGRMSGMLSMGAGGHVETEDFTQHLVCTDEQVNEHSVLAHTGSMDLMETVEESLLREFAEEVLLYNGAGTVMSDAVLGVNVTQGLQRLGFVWDGLPEVQPDYVGSTHFGVVYAIEIPNEVASFEMAEEMNDALGWFGVSDIFEFGGVAQFEKQFTDEGAFEPWSKFIIDRLPEVERHLLETYHATRA